MKLSVCMIVRNEAANLPAAMASIRSVADEICVLDTGSSDASISIARESGAAIEHFEWCDDFAAAINANIAMARGEWILRLDADEQLLPESIEPLREAMDDASTFMHLVLRRDLSTLGPPEQFSEMYVDRLFRRRSDVRFVGRCHAHPSVPWETLASRDRQRIMASTITLRHTGYLGPMRAAKLRRGARLMELELVDRPGQLYYLAELGRTQLQLGDAAGHETMRQAMEIVLREANTTPQPIVATVLEHALLVDADRRPAAMDAAMIQTLVRRWFPRSAPLWWSLAKLHFTQQQFASATEALETLRELKRTDAYDRAISFDPRLIGDDADFNLAVCYANLGRLGESIALFESLLGSPGRGKSAADNLQIVRQMQSAAGADGA